MPPSDFEGDLAGRIAVVTGSGSGIGRAVARRFAAADATVVVADVDAAGGEETVAAIEDAGGSAVAVPTDVTDEDDVRGLIDAVVDEFGSLDVLVNNAGGSFDDDNAHRVGLDAWRRVLDVNLTGTFLCTRAALPALADGGGALVHVSSVNALAGIGLTAYSAAKAGVCSLSRVVAVQYGRHGVRSNVVCPGTTITPATSPKLAADDAPAREAWIDQYPLGRFARPEDVAEAALFLASDRAAFVTGVTLPVDGGFTAAGVDHDLGRRMYDVDEPPSRGDR